MMGNAKALNRGMNDEYRFPRFFVSRLTANEGSPAAHKSNMLHKLFFKFGKTAMLSLFVALVSVSMSSCSSDDDEPGNPSSSGSNNTVIINNDGTATGGAVFSRIDGTTFFLDYVKYKVVDSHLEIIGYDGQELPEVPKLYAEVTIDGTLYKTREICYNAFRGARITSIVIPQTVSIILVSCFSDCTFLGSVTLPEGLTHIGNSCFYGCTSLSSVTFPESIKSIRDSCFYGCTSLNSVTFKSDCPGIDDYCFSGMESKPVAYVPMRFLENYKKKVSYYFSEIVGY